MPPRFNLKRLDASTGLQYDERNVFISEDAAGFTWIGSSAGPYRYDGQQLRLFQFSEDRERSQVISNFFNLGKSDVWFSTPIGLGHYSYATDKLTTHEIKVAATAPLDLQLIEVDTLRNILWLTNGNELISVPATSPAEILSQTPSKSVRHLPLTKDENSATLLGFPWLLKTGLERITITKGEVVSVDTSKDKTIQSLTITGGTRDASGRIWLCGSEGLHQYDLVQDKLVKTHLLADPKNSRILDVEAYEDLLLVATAKDGIWWFDPEQGRFWRKLETAAKSSLKATAKSLSIYSNKSGVVFATREKGGVEVMVPRSVNCEIILDSLKNDSPDQKIIQDIQGRIYASRQNGEIAVFDQKGIKITSLRPNTTASTSIAGTIKGDIYCSVGEEIYKIETSKVPTLSFLLKSPTPIKSLLSLDKTLIVQNSSGFHLLKKGNLHPLELGLSINHNTFAHNIGHSSILINNLNGKWYILKLAFNDDNDLTAPVKIDSIPAKGELNYASFGLTNDTLFVGQIQGLVRYVRNTRGDWIEYDKPLAGCRVVAMKQLQSFQNWVLTDQGLKFGSTNLWTHIREEHGLPDASGITNALLVSGDSVVWAGFREGLIRYRISKSGQVQISTGKTYLQKYFINEMEYSETAQRVENGISFANKGQRLQLQLGTVGLFDQQPAEYRYRLLGISDQWQDLGNNNNIYLQSLSPGKYILEATAIDASGKTLEPIKITIFSSQPYWETWWFKLAIVGAIILFVSGISYLIYRRRLQSERSKYEKELLVAQERDRIARELHDDLGTDLSSILYLSDTDGEALDAEDQAEIVELSQGALSRMRVIVNALDGGEATLGNFWKTTIREARAACRRYKVDLIVKDNPGPALGKVMLKQLMRRNLDLLIKESVSNALRHGAPTVLTLSLICERQKALVLTITDDGIGFEMNKINRGMGLGNLEDRAKNLGGNITISSEINAGTKICITIPLDAC